MAITFDAASNGKTGTSTTSLTYAHTTGTGATKLVVGFQIDTAPSSITGITFNGVALTQAVTKTGAAANRYSAIWYLDNPDIGTYNIVITASSNEWITSGAVSLKGTASGIGVTGGNDASTGNPTVTVTTTVDNSWLIDSLYQNNAALSMAPDSPSVERYTTGASADGFEGWGSSKATTTAGSYSMTWTQGAGAADGWVISIVEIKEAAASGPANLKSLDTNVKANIKSYNTNLLANIKSIDTNA